VSPPKPAPLPVPKPVQPPIDPGWIKPTQGFQAPPAHVWANFEVKPHEPEALVEVVWEPAMFDPAKAEFKLSVCFPRAIGQDLPETDDGRSLQTAPQICAMIYRPLVKWLALKAA
jgi:hypothetical protein